MRGVKLLCVMRTLALAACIIISLMASSSVRATNPEPRGDARAWVEKTLRTMTLEEKIGQLIVPPMIAPFLDPRSSDVKELEREVTVYKVGGFHTFAHDSIEFVRLHNRLQKAAKVPLLITADLEGGAGYQFTGGTRVPRAMALGATGSEELVYEAGRITALEAARWASASTSIPSSTSTTTAEPHHQPAAFGEDRRRRASAPPTFAARTPAVCWPPPSISRPRRHLGGLAHRAAGHRARARAPRSDRAAALPRRH
jgi:hypothetical protein